jgi:opacity protein-like surface antigen
MRRSLLAVVSLVALSSIASAQEKVSAAPEKLPVEIGIDGSLERAFSTPGITTLSLPVGRIRAGMYVLPVLEFEGSLAVTGLRAEGGSLSTITAGAGVLYHFSPLRTKAQPYVRPFFEWTRASSSGGGTDVSASATGFGAGLGTKLPLADRFAGRFEVAYARQSEVNRLVLLFGLSFFTR